MAPDRLRFSIAAHAAWAPGLTTAQAWSGWAQSPFRISGSTDAPVAAMPAMLRRRAGFLGRMALEVAYRCLDGRTGIPTIFCSRHGEVARAVALLNDLARAEPLSPTSFGLSVHNAGAGLFSIARGERSNHTALAGGAATVEHGIVEACGLLADGASEVLLVAYDCPLPAPLDGFADCDEQPHAFAWLLTGAGADPITLGLAAAPPEAQAGSVPGGLEILRFQLSGAARLQRRTGAQQWTWTRDDG